MNYLSIDLIKMHSNYEGIGKIGEGAYGIVMKCRNKDTGEIVAIKKFKDVEDEVVQKSMIRELKVLKSAKDNNIVKLKECFKKKGQLYLVFEYVEKNLLEVIEKYPEGLDSKLVKSYIFQLCKAVNYIHNLNIVHRDIKPENILITNENVLKVCDFGFARPVVQNKDGILTDYVATRWYRAPELLLGSKNYGKEVDLWAIGCIMGEITDGQPMFPGDNELNQINMIQKLLGTLPEELIDMYNSNPLFSGKKLDFVQKPETLERRYYGKLSKVAFSFMKSLLKLDPNERISANDLLLHPYFEDMRIEDPEMIVLRSSSQEERLSNKQITIKKATNKQEVKPGNKKSTNTKEEQSQNTKAIYQGSLLHHNITTNNFYNMNCKKNSKSPPQNGENFQNNCQAKLKMKIEKRQTKFKDNYHTSNPQFQNLNNYKTFYNVNKKEEFQEPECKLERNKSNFGIKAIEKNMQTQINFKPVTKGNNQTSNKNLLIIEEESYNQNQEEEKKNCYDSTNNFKLSKNIPNTQRTKYKSDTGSEYTEELLPKESFMKQVNSQRTLQENRQTVYNWGSNNSNFLPQIVQTRGHENNEFHNTSKKSKAFM